MTTFESNFKRWGAFSIAALLVACGGGSDTVSGTITGLTASGLVLSNGSETLAVAASSGTFTFATVLTDGTTYTVTVVTQPTGLNCVVTNGTGTADSTANGTSVVVTCSPVFPISGIVTGLAGTGLQLSDTVETINVAAGAGSFAFPTQLKTGANYAVTVVVQPSNQACTVANGSGTVASVAVSTVAVSCR